MPTVTAQGKTFECESGSNLRQVLLDNNIDVYNGNAKTINCRGLGTCGTCAVGVEGEVSEASWKEKARLGLPPHSGNSLRRLSCQTKVLGDVRVTKYDGFWGQGSEVVWSSSKS
ncbi:2Fe-2S iron-sulfur cluster-binding protein [Calothrix sp. CCY 0018]|uniref:2Fe-2S iron-sulfur cluster-binding protein n=1 Tax=Calothrix sp. CCY 0018 TaxID=3103864 RepID=UPI0039C7328C